MRETLTEEDLEILKASASNCNIFLKYYFDIELLPHQLMMAHAEQKSLLTLGGRGSGKTFGYIMSYIWLATVMPDFRVLWTSFTGNQASIAFYEVAYPILSQSERFRKFLPEGTGSMKKKPYPSIHIQIPGLNEPESVLHFMPSDASGSGDTKRGFTWDCIHIDEGGLIHDKSVISTLRPSMRGRRHSYGRPPRMGRMSVSTTPTSAPWLKEWWDSANDPDYPEYAPDKYLAVRVSSYANTTLTQNQLDSFWQDMSEEEKQVEIEAGFPEYFGNDFSPTVVDLCQDPALNEEVQNAIEEGLPGYEYRTSGKEGVMKYQKPASDFRKYILIGDPGTGNPPYRNAGVILVWDVTEEPYEMVYFDWVAGNGDYRPFFRQYEWAHHYYRPIYSGFDSTGTQKAMDQLYFEEKGLIIDGIAVTTEKPVMINALKIMMQKAKLRFPLIKGVRQQLLSYKSDNDKKLSQDIVMAMTMSAHRMRQFFYISPDQVGPGDDSDDFMMDDRNSLRDSSRIVGR